MRPAFVYFDAVTVRIELGPVVSRVWLGAEAVGPSMTVFFRADRRVSASSHDLPPSVN